MADPSPRPRAAASRRRRPHADETRLAWLGADNAEPRGRAPRAWPIAASLVGLAAVAGGGWYVARSHGAPTPVADGSIIHAPAGPYKVRPARQDGSSVDGTGDISYAVAEGKPAPRAVLAGGEAAPTAVVATGDPAAAVPGVPAPAGVPVQIGAFAQAAQAEAQWPKLVARYPQLAPLHHRVVPSRADLGAVFGLQAMAPDRQAAVGLCAALRGGGLACQVKD